MKKIAILFMLFLITAGVVGQGLSTEHLLAVSAMPNKRVKAFLQKNGYTFSGREQSYDTLFTKFEYRPPTTGWSNLKDTGYRCLIRCDVRQASLATYHTASRAEFLQLINQFTKEGFYCNEPTNTLAFKPLLFQYKESTVRTRIDTLNDIPVYSMEVYRKSFPAPKDIHYADDLLAFSSHEQLEYYFGKNNVKSDIYYFSENEIAKCSVLFLNTRRQVVFIWKDELNKCRIAHLLFGGQQKLESAMESNRFVGENSWVFKSGIRPGMSLMELRRLNGSNFKFFGGNAAFSGSVVGGAEGNLNFKKENVILGCMNCNDNNFSSSTLISADDALADQRILFVLSIALNPYNDHPVE